MSDSDKKVYAIRNLCFWYDDEYYFSLISSENHDGHISAIFNDKNSALKEWKRLEYEFSHHVDFVNILGYEEAHSRLEQLGLQNHEEQYLKNLNSDDLFDIIHKTDCHVYSFHEYSHDLKVKTLWNTKENSYEICDGDNEHDSRANLFLTTFLSKDNAIPLSGKLSDFSDTPQLLSLLIKDNPNIEYNEHYQTLRIKPDEKTLNSVNALLKNPLYEIRYLTIQEIYEIEQTLNSPNNQVA
jgi:hypothetical protein